MFLRLQSGIDKRIEREDVTNDSGQDLYGSSFKKGFKVILHPDLEDGGYWVECPEFPGCSSQGDSVEEALDVIKMPLKVISKSKKS